MKLSVCIPVYNVAPYIERCVRSLFAQTYEDIEYLFVDDATPDDSVAIIERVLKEYPTRQDQVKIIRHDRNRGLIAARKTALKAATGDLIAHCDSDDWLDVDFYERLVGRLLETDADMSIGAIVGEKPDGRRLTRAFEARVASGGEMVAGFGTIPGLQAMWNKVFRRRVFEATRLVWPETIRIGEDICHMMQLIAGCAMVATEPSACYHYRMHEASMTNTTDPRRIVSDHIAVFDILHAALPAASRTACLRELARLILYWGMAHGGLSLRQVVRWRKTYGELGGAYAFSDMCTTGQRVMALARFSPLLARGVATLKKNHIRDVL